MGDRMWREPEEEPLGSVAAKVDKAAATSRSTIRREATVRPSRYSTISSPRSRHSIRSHLLEDYRPRAVPSRPSVTLDEAELDAETERLRRRRETRLRIRWGSLNEDDSNDIDQRQAGEELLRDALRFDRPGQRLRLLRPPRESALRFEMAPSLPLPNLGPPSTSPRERRRVPWLDDYPESRLALDGPFLPTSSVELTPGFAPAQGTYRDTDRASGEVIRAAIDLTARDWSALDTPVSESWDASYPPLRRVGDLSPRPYSFRPDGLGDRQRSPGSSVNYSNAEEDTWETLLTTMEEDDNQPSAASSFTSAVASASTSRRSESTSRSGRSSQTTTTSVGDLEPVEAGQPCETDSDAQDTLALDDPSAPATARRPRMRRILYSPPSPSFEERRLGSARRRNAARESVVAAERRTAAEERLRWMERQAAEAEAEVAQMQSLIDRLARREDIPTELWEAAGLSRMSSESQ